MNYEALSSIFTPVINSPHIYTPNFQYKDYIMGLFLQNYWWWGRFEQGSICHRFSEPARCTTRKALHKKNTTEGCLGGFLGNKIGLGTLGSPRPRSRAALGRNLLWHRSVPLQTSMSSLPTAKKVHFGGEPTPSLFNTLSSCKWLPWGWETPSPLLGDREYLPHGVAVRQNSASTVLSKMGEDARRAPRGAFFSALPFISE